MHYKPVMGEDWILAVLSHHDRVLVFCDASTSSITDWVPRTTRQVSLLTRWNLWIWNLTSPCTERASVEWRSMEMSGREVDNCWTHKQIHFWGGGFFLLASYTVAEFFEICPGEVIGLCSGGHSVPGHCSAVRSKHSFTSLMKLMSELSDQGLWIETALKALPRGEATQKPSLSAWALECHCWFCTSCLLSLGHRVHTLQWQGNIDVLAGQPCHLSKWAPEGVPHPLGWIYVNWLPVMFEKPRQNHARGNFRELSSVFVGFLWNFREAN